MSSCPYCDHTFSRETPDGFETCPGCGYRSALVRAAEGEYLVIDSRLPDMMTHYRQLMAEDADRVVVIDRRTCHNQIAGVDRRRTAD